MPVDLLADIMPLNNEQDSQPQDLLADVNPSAEDIASLKIDQLYPNMPDWLKTALLSISSSQQQPTLDKTAEMLDKYINEPVLGTGIPAGIRGILQGASAPVQSAGALVNLLRGQGYNVPKQMQIPEVRKVSEPNIPFTNIQVPLQQIGEIGGEIGGAMIAGSPVYKGATKALEAANAPKILQSLLSSGVTGTALMPENPLLGAGLGLIAPPIAKGTKYLSEDLAPNIKTLFKEQKPAEAFEKMLQRHDTLDRSAKELYKISDTMAASRDLPTFKLNAKVFDTAEKYLKPLGNYDEILAKAKQGNYKALTKLQSDMGKRAAKIYSNKNATLAEIDQADALLKARNILNDSLESQLIQNGHADMASVRNQANNLYKEKMQTYFHKNLKPSIRNVFGEKRVRPGQTDMDLLKPFMERSDVMKNFLANHPEMRNEVELARAKQQAVESLKPIGKGIKATGVGGGMIKALELLKDLL